MKGHYSVTPRTVVGRAKVGHVAIVTLWVGEFDTREEAEAAAAKVLADVGAERP